MKLRPYQLDAVEFAADKGRAAVFLEPGYGKTAIASTWLDRYTGETPLRVVIVAPLRVCTSVWQSELARWCQRPLGVVSLTGKNEKNRTAAMKARGVNVYLVNPDLVAWLFSKFVVQYTHLIVDESCLFKSHTAIRTKALMRASQHIQNVLLLSGTPIGNSHQDLMTQMFMLDGGVSLGRNVTTFRNRYMWRDHWSPFPKFKLNKGAAEKIEQACSHLIFKANSKMQSPLPKSIYNFTVLNFDHEQRSAYKTLCKESILEYQDAEGDKQTEAFTRGAIWCRLCQFTSGFVYTGDDKEKVARGVNTLKLDALLDMLDYGGERYPTIVVYNFIAERDMIKDALPTSVVMSDDDKSIDQWNEGKIDTILCHPKSAGHGLNLQHGGCRMVWFSLPTSTREYVQMCHRLIRSGQNKTVTVDHLVVKSTVDAQLYKSIKGNKEALSNLLAYLKSEAP